MHAAALATVDESGVESERWDLWDGGRALDLSDADGTGNYVDLRCRG